MFEYKFVRIELASYRLQKKPAEDYQKIINQHAKEGWRLVQVFVAPSENAIGYPSYYEIIFEKNIN
jgi:hypothetical protein